MLNVHREIYSSLKKSENKSFKTFVTRKKQRSDSSLHSHVLKKVDILLEFDREELKKKIKISKTKKGELFLSLSPTSPFTSSLMSTSRTLVLQMFVKYCHRSLLHSVNDYWKWFDVFTLRWKKEQKTGKKDILCIALDTSHLLLLLQKSYVAVLDRRM